MKSLTTVFRRLLVVGVGTVGMALVASAADEGATTPPAGSADAFVYVKMTSPRGDIILELDQSKAPATVANFMSYTDKGFFDGTVIHRVVNTPNSIGVIQGGGFTADLKQKPTDPPIKNEWANGLTNDRGTIAMARTGDPNSATSQWFINTKDNAPLSRALPRFGNAGYAVFGKVIGGMDVVDGIVALPVVEKPLTDDKGNTNTARDVPSEIVAFTKVQRIKPEEVSAQIAAARAAEAEIEKVKSAARAEESAKGRQAGEAALAAAADFLKGKEIDASKGTLTDSGLWYYDVTPGTGKPATPTSTVKAHYTGWLVDGTKFDSSLDKPGAPPAEFPLTGVIPGWTEGVGAMKTGGKRFMVIRPDLGYGARSMGTIPPNSVLVFEVELVEVK